MKKIVIILLTLTCSLSIYSQIDTKRVMQIGKNAIHFEDYVLAVQYFNQAIKAKPFLAEPYYYRALAKFNLEDYAGAEEDCSSCIKRNPYWISAYQLRAASLQNQGKMESAEKDYEKALFYFPENKYSLINSAIVDIKLSKFEKAEKHLASLIQMHPDYIPGYMANAALYIEKEDTAKAYKYYDLAIEKDSQYSQTYSARGILYLQQKRYKEALEDLNESIKLNSENSGDFINRGLVKYHLNDLRGAMQDYDSVIELAPNDVVALLNRGLLRVKVADYNGALTDFDKVLSVEPNNDIASINKAIVNMEMGNHANALKEMDIIIKKYPNFYQGYYARADLKKKMNDMLSSEKDFLLAQKIEKRVKDDKKAQSSLTRNEKDKDIEKFNLLVVADKEEKGQNTYENKIRGRVQDHYVNNDIENRFVVTYYESIHEVYRPTYYAEQIADANRNLGLQKKLRMTNNEAALNEEQITEHFQSISNTSKQMELTPKDASLYVRRAVDFMLVQDYESAIQDLNRAVDIKPDMTLAYFARAIAKTKQMEIDMANSVQIPNPRKETIKIKPTKQGGVGNNIIVQTIDPEAINDHNTQDYQTEAIMRDYAKIISLSPDFIFAYYNRAEIYYRKKDFRAAIEDYNSAIKREGEFAEAYFNRGFSYLAIGEKEKGLADISKAGELGVVSAYSIVKRMSK